MSSILPEFKMLIKSFAVEIDDIIMQDIYSMKDKKLYIKGQIYIKIHAELTKDFRTLIATDTE